MTVEENKAIVRRLMEEGFNANCPAVFDEMLADDFANHDPSQPTVADREGLKQWWASTGAAFPDQRTIIEGLIGEGDQVVKQATWRGTQTGEFNGLPPTGRSVTISIISIYRLESGKVTEISWGYDSFAMLQQLGVIPVPVPAG